MRERPDKNADDCYRPDDSDGLLRARRWLRVPGERPVMDSLERALLGSFVHDPSAWSRVKSQYPLRPADFMLTSHKRIFDCLERLAERGDPMDLPSLSNELQQRGELDKIGGPGYLGVLLDGIVPENVLSYARQVRQESQRQRASFDFKRLQKELGEAETVEGRLALLDAMREKLRRESTDQNWRGLFHTWKEFENAPPLRFAIDGFLQEAGVTLIGGLAGHGKTLLMLAMAKALLEELPLFGHELFTVPRPAQRVLYLIPESSIGPFRSRLELFRLQEHVRSGRLLVSTLSSRDPVSLSDPRLLKAAEGADVFLDTAVRFMEGSENDAQDTRPFVQTLFRLLHVGARSITGAHHAPKGFEGQNFMTLENILRGSGDIGAMLSTAWGVRQVDASRTALYVQNVKPRDFQPCAPFILEGRPHLDNTGHFLMIHKPGEAGELSKHLVQRNKGGRPAGTNKDDKLRRAVEMRREGVSFREIEKTIRVPRSNVARWLKENDDRDASQTVPIVGQFRDNAEPDGETPN